MNNRIRHISPCSDPYPRKQARILSAVMRLLYLEEREVAEALDISQGLFQRFLHGTSLSVEEWGKFCQFTGMRKDLIQYGNISRFAAIHGQYQALTDDGIGCAQRFRQRVANLFWKRTYFGTERTPEFQQLVLNGRDLSRMDLNDSNFLLSEASGADFSYSRMNSAFMAWMILKNATFIGTDLSQANLSWSVLVGADLSEAVLDGADLFGAVYDETTRLPFGRLEAKQRGMEFLFSSAFSRRLEFEGLGIDALKYHEAKGMRSGGRAAAWAGFGSDQAASFSVSET